MISHRSSKKFLKVYSISKAVQSSVTERNKNNYNTTVSCLMAGADQPRICYLLKKTFSLIPTDSKTINVHTSYFFFYLKMLPICTNEAKESLNLHPFPHYLKTFLHSDTNEACTIVQDHHLCLETRKFLGATLDLLNPSILGRDPGIYMVNKHAP